MKNKFSDSRKTVVVLMVFMMFVAFPKQSKSQDQTPIQYALVEYFKVKQENIEKYLDFTKNFWKPLQEERIAQNEIVGWRLFKVRFTGTNDEYNFVSAAFFNDFNKLEKVYSFDPQKVHPERNIEDKMEEFYKVCDLVKTDLLIANSHTENDVPYKFLQINFMNVKQGDESEYLEVENSIWKPVHQEMLDSGEKTGWSLWSLVFPSGAGLDYQVLAVDGFADFSQIGKVNYSDAFAKVHKGKNVDELFERTNKSRILVRSELWESVDDIFTK